MGIEELKENGMTEILKAKNPTTKIFLKNFLEFIEISDQSSQEENGTKKYIIRLNYDENQEIQLKHDASIDYIKAMMTTKFTMLKQAADSDLLIMAYSDIGMLLLNFENGTYLLSARANSKPITESGIRYRSLGNQKLKVYYFDSEIVLFKNVHVEKLTPEGSPERGIQSLEYIA